MDKLNLDKKINFERKEIHTPELVFKKISKELNEITNGYIVGTTSPYDGAIESYSVKSVFAKFGESLALGMEKDIQDELGELGNRIFRNEYYISCPQVDGYCFRVCFYEYGISGYPVRVVLEQGIADEITNEDDGGYIFDVDSQDDLEQTIINILNTQRVAKIIQALVDATNIIGTQVDEQLLIEEKTSE